MLGLGCDFASEDAVADERVEQHERKDEKPLPPEHECKTGVRRCRFVDGKDEGDHVRPERDGEGAKGRQEDQYDHRKGQFIAAVSNTGREHNSRQRADHGEDEQIRTLQPSPHHLKIFDQRIDKDDDKKYEQPDREIRDQAVGCVADVGFTFLDQPTGAKKRIAETQSDAAERREGTEPAEVTTGLLTVGHRQALDERADRQALDERCRKRSA